MTYKAATKPRPEEMALRDVALAYPEASEDFPWDHRAMKVKGKTFAWMGTAADGSFFFTAKLPSSNAVALMLPFASATGYGLGRSGWVSAGFQKGEAIPVGLLREWVDESYRAVAPKTLVKRLGESNATAFAPAPKAKTAKPKPTTSSRNKPASKKPAAKKAAAKKAAAKKPATRKPATQKPVAKKPVAKKPATKKPAAKKR